LEQFHPEQAKPATAPVDKWILDKLAKCIEESTSSFETHTYPQARASLMQFFWHDFCDNYLELCKNRLYEPKSAEDKASAQTTLHTCLWAFLRLISPFTPFITEELFSQQFKRWHKLDSIHHADWPAALVRNPEAEHVGDLIVEALTQVRKVKSEQKMSMKTPIKKLVITAALTNADHALNDLKSTVYAEQIVLEKPKEGAPVTISAVF
jgi:valyl-tRNA synthetase